MMMYQNIIEKLAEGNIPSPRLEARILMAHVCNISPNEVTGSLKLNERQNIQLEHLLQQRLAHKPLDKILGHKEFYKYDFIVNEDVLSPRPDTEVLLEAALELIQDSGISSVLDLGVGSGCILLSLLKEFDLLEGIGIDKSESALQVAKTNAVKLNVEKRCKLINADWFEPQFTDHIAKKVDLIVSNPPYIPTADIATLDTEVRNFDPMPALDGGIDGLDSYKRIAQIAPYLLQENGYIILEIGINQTQAVQNIFEQSSFKLLKIINDLSGIERCLIFVKK